MLRADLERAAVAGLPRDRGEGTGYGGMAAVAGLKGASQTTVAAGAEEASPGAPEEIEPERSRRPGGGRPGAERRGPG